jgi:hypothetical protein
VTLCVTNPLVGATYAWSNGANGMFMTSGTCGVFSGRPPVSILAVGTCGVGVNSAAGTTVNTPDLMNTAAGVAINSDTRGCVGTSVNLNGTSNICVNNPSN